MSTDSRLPKKQHRRDEAPLDVEPPPATSVPSATVVSYKEAVMNDLATDDDDLVPIDDDGINLLDDDIRIGESDGVPFIDFSSRIQDLLLRVLSSRLFGVLFLWHIRACQRALSEIHPQEPTQAFEANMVAAAEPQPPRDPYGPWMLVDNRRCRPAKPTNQPAPVEQISIASHFRFNPIFIEAESSEQPTILTDNPQSAHPTGETIPQNAHPVPSVMTDLVAFAVDPSSASALSSSVDKPKPRIKTSVALRKAPLAVLKLRDINIMPKKVGIAGPSRKSSLNPAKHSVIVTSESAQPIVMGQAVDQQRSLLF
ncbi:hypothetical protein V6N13_071660 [Hibiscus sabdariffa]|uniref:Uncharacterized protein n=1 Tax=Hibiscus sabdariffa TaxID=183260 RepID=A0ABR2TD33_9ROSI